jgi:hypothetical protein
MKEQQAAGVFKDSNLPVYTVSPGEVSPAYGIIH